MHWYSRCWWQLSNPHHSLSHSFGLIGRGIVLGVMILFIPSSQWQWAPIHQCSMINCWHKICDQGLLTNAFIIIQKAKLTIIADLPWDFLQTCLVVIVWIWLFCATLVYIKSVKRPLNSKMCPLLLLERLCIFICWKEHFLWAHL